MSNKYIEEELHFRLFDVQTQYQCVIMEVDDKVELNRMFARREDVQDGQMKLKSIKITFAASIPANLEHKRASPFLLVTLKYD